MNTGGGIPAEALLDLRRLLDDLPPRHPGRRALVEGAAGLYGVSRATVYRALAGQLRPKGLRRADRGEPRKIARTELERYCEIVAALKVRTSNLKRRRLSTANCIALLEAHGVETPDGLVRAPTGLLHKATVNRYLQLWGYDHVRMTRAPAAVRFEARTSNAMWQFDISPSDLKEIEQPAWIDPDRKGLPVPMLFSGDLYRWLDEPSFDTHTALCGLWIPRPVLSSSGLKREIQVMSSQRYKSLHFCGMNCGTTFLSRCFYWIIGGEGGIRTLGTLLTYTHFPGVLLKPLGHLSRERRG